MQQLNTRHLVTLSLVAPGIGLSVLLAASPASAATYEVGRGKPYASLAEVAPRLAAGDVVLVEGDATYPGDLFFKKSGTEAQKITIRGVRVNGRRPVLSGGKNTVIFGGNHYTFEGFDITGGSGRCVFNKAHDITIRDSVVHDCAGHGILGADSESGSLTLEYVEVYACGSGDTRHPIYIATDEETRLGSVFRMRHCYVHDGNDGNSVKSRAERNEIYYNWIEGAKYHELELIGPDGQDEGLAREDSDVVGNVIVKTGQHFAVRVGGDGTGQTWGRFRFVNNTFLLAPGSRPAIRMFDGIESVEMSNNVFYRRGGGGVEVYVDRSATWKNGAASISGANNWVPAGSSAIPGAWRGTVQGADPGFTNLSSLDLRPVSSSPLVNAGSSATSTSGHPFPKPLTAPQFSPRKGARAASGPLQRPVAGTIDIGAYESGSGLAALAMRTADTVRDLDDSDSSAEEEAWNVDGDAAPSDGEADASDTDGGDASDADASDVDASDVGASDADASDADPSAGDCAADGDDTAACSEAAQGNAGAPHGAHASACSVGGGLAGGPVAGSGALLAGAAALLGAALRRRGRGARA
ncbi:right-handed parallel beta-helix repeat-containing protein [Sorangium sp. So ce204]|uniref:right-handed parallel beta-helix repeat-containing protein n=1 Tax=Sorangium sp. So ce204 TaxID=3133288 RepID=UPI003F602C6E